jgi:hypothetical protein
MAFANNQLTEVIIGSNVASIGDAAFGGNRLTSIIISDSVIDIGEMTFANNQLTDVIIPDGVNSIGASAFFNNQLTSVIIGNSVTSIGTRAFASNFLPHVIIPDSVTSIGPWAFEDTRILLRAHQQYGNFFKQMSGDRTIIIYYVGTDTNIQIPPEIQGNPVTDIWRGAFRGKFLTGIIIPDSVTDIRPFAFYDNQISSITIGNDVRIWGEYDYWHDTGDGGFGFAFAQFYRDHGRRAGTYTYDNGIWSAHFR